MFIIFVIRSYYNYQVFIIIFNNVWAVILTFFVFKTNKGIINYVGIYINNKQNYIFTLSFTIYNIIKYLLNTNIYVKYMNNVH